MADKQPDEKKITDFEILQEDDEFEEFEDEWGPQEEEVETSLWVTDWDDEGLDDDFGKQLRAELEKANTMDIV